MLLLRGRLKSSVDTKNRRPTYPSPCPLFTHTLAKLPELAPEFGVVGVDDEIL